VLTAANDVGAAALIRMNWPLTESVAMRHRTEPAPTSGATTRNTEPEVVAAISSAEGTPDQPLSFPADGLVYGIGRPLAVLAATMVLGYGAVSWWRGRA
jgi:hypothetical protein